ncbi:cell division protein FtsZ [bacterium]|nr:cell division protein FtsZ [bacterium]
MLIKANIDKIAKIKVIGVGGAGGNALNSMITQGNIVGVDFMAINTDKQDLNINKADEILQIGTQLTNGLGSGALPEIGKKAAEESVEEIKKHLDGYDMIFIAAGMGGGTGTGASPVVAKLARDSGALTVAVVTKPFKFEGSTRLQNAEEGILNLKDNVDALIIIPNQKLLEVEQKSLPLKEAFLLSDNILTFGVKGISDLIVHPGLINVDFADVKTIMKDAGSALMGIGTASGENRAEKAAQQAIHSPLLDAKITGATGILINITSDPSLTLEEVQKVSEYVVAATGTEVNVILGANPDDDLKDTINVTVIATGFETEYSSGFAGDFSPNVFKPALKDADPEEIANTSSENAKDKDVDLDFIDDEDTSDKDPYRIPPFLRRG